MLSIWTANWLFWFGLLFVGFILFSPDGLVGIMPPITTMASNSPEKAEPSGSAEAKRWVKTLRTPVLEAIRENEQRARFLGYPTNRYKLVAFTVSATAESRSSPGSRVRSTPP
jgi:ABC-type branched-subunit amino acid transport system permease subunit